MTELNVTATVDLKRATVKDANGAEMHNQHDPEVEHDNKQIFKDDTKYNLHFKLLNRDKLLQEQYGEMIEKRNENTAKQFNSGKISQTQYEERITSVDKYLNHEGKGAKKALTNYVFTLGNVDTEFKILDALKYDYIKQPVFDKTKKKITHYRPKLTDSKQRSQFLTLLGTAYLGVVSEINSRHSGLKVTNLWLHVDEGGMPHAQGTIVNMGHTASGKASYNLNRALAEFNGTKSKKVNGKVELTKFRETTDKYMIDMFNHRLKSMGLDKKLHLNFVRSGGEHGLSMKEYQENQNLKQAKSASQNAQETVRASYKQITGKEPINDEKQPLDVTECLHGIKAKLNQSEEAKEQAEKMVEEAKKKLSELQRQQQQEADRLKQLQVDAVTRRKNNDKLADENKKLKEKNQQRRLQRIRNAKRELTENGLKFTDKQGNPIFVTDDTVQIAEKQVDDYRKKQVNAVKTERQKLIRQQKSQKIIQEKAKKYDETVQFIQNKTGEKVGGQTTLIKWVGRTLNRVKNALDSANKAENERNKFAEAFRDIYGALKHGFNEITPKRFLDGFRTGDSAKKFAKMVYIEQNGHYWNEPKRETQVQSRVQSRQQPNYQKQKDDGFGFGD